MFSENKLKSFAGKPLASARWSRQGACSWSVKQRESRAHRHGGDREEISESQREFAAMHSESCWTQSKVRRKDRCIRF